MWKFWGKWAIPRNDLNLKNYDVAKCAKNRQIWDRMFWRVDNTIIPCYMNVIHQRKWSGLALGENGGTNRSQSDFFDKKGLKTTKSAFETRYMTYMTNNYYISMAKKKFRALVAQNGPFWAQNSPKYNFSLKMTNECYINPAKL